MSIRLSSIPNWALWIPAALCAAILWAAWGVLGEMQKTWSTDPTYSHGYLVPLISLVILWSRRDQRPALPDQPSWWGVVFIAVGAALQLVAGLYYIRPLSGLALLCDVAGVVVLVGRWPALRWAGPSIAFLIFMIPLPWRFQVFLHQPLQHISTVISGYALQTLGFPAVVEGNVILLNEVDLGVIDACSGLKMLVVFIALATAIALLSKRRPIDKIIIVASSIPIAMISNVTRITLTGMCYETVGSKWAQLVFHDLAGWMMMAFGLILLFLELRYLSLLFVEDATDSPQGFAPRAVAAAAR